MSRLSVCLPCLLVHMFTEDQARMEEQLRRADKELESLQNIYATNRSHLYHYRLVLKLVTVSAFVKVNCDAMRCDACHQLLPARLPTCSERVGC